jgi:hypothetical protein
MTHFCLDGGVVRRRRELAISGRHSKAPARLAVRRHDVQRVQETVLAPIPQLRPDGRCRATGVVCTEDGLLHGLHLHIILFFTPQFDDAWIQQYMTQAEACQHASGYGVTDEGQPGQEH